VPRTGQLASLSDDDRYPFMPKMGAE